MDGISWFYITSQRRGESRVSRLGSEARRGILGSYITSQRWGIPGEQTPV